MNPFTGLGITCAICAVAAPTWNWVFVTMAIVAGFSGITTTLMDRKRR